MQATISSNQISISYSAREGREYLTVDVPNGWDDVKKLTNRVLAYNGSTFAFTGWNSDALKCYFARSNNIATIN